MDKRTSKMAEPALMEPREFDFCINVNDLEESGLRALKIVKPSWQPGKIKSKVLTGGITNKLICFFEEGKFKEDAVVMRVYGEKTDLIIDRDAEKKNMTLLAQKGICPPLYGTFPNGIMYGFAQGAIVDEMILREEKLKSLVAEELVKLQQVKYPEDEGRQLESNWCKKVHDWLDVLPDKFDDPEKQKKYEKMIKSKSTLVNETNMLHQRMESMKSPIVFCHSDLLLGNIIYDKKLNKVTFIDHEYGMYNYQPYDIGNHFCEYAGIDTVDYDRYPDKEYQLSWLRLYIQSWNKQAGKDVPITSEEVEKLYAHVNLCALAAHHFWGIWALIQAKYSTIDFNYLDYAIQRFDEYWRRRDEFLSFSKNIDE